MKSALSMRGLRPLKTRTPLLLLILVLVALTTTGASCLIGAGAVISCGPIPMSWDQCNGGWIKSLFGTAADPNPSCDLVELGAAWDAWVSQGSDVARDRWLRAAEECGVTCSCQGAAATCHCRRAP